jgi:hypothetical protein
MEFSTVNLPLAAALTASSKLKLIRIDATPTRATMVFDDPQEIGSSLELEFLSGQFMVPASAYNIQLRAVRRQIEIKLAAARTKETARG